MTLERTYPSQKEVCDPWSHGTEINALIEYLNYVIKLPLL